MFKLKAHIYFIITSLIIVTGSAGLYVLYDNEAIDINIGDTYYVISIWDVTYILFIVYNFLAVLYYFLYRLRLKTRNALYSIHTGITCGSVLIYLLLYPFVLYADTSIFSPGYINILLTVLVTLVLTVQPLFIIAICIGFVKRIRN